VANPANSFLGEAVLTNFEEMLVESQLRVIEEGQIVRTFIAAFEESATVTGHLTAFAIALKDVQNLAGDPEWAAFAKGSLAAKIEFMQACRPSGGKAPNITRQPGIPPSSSFGAAPTPAVFDGSFFSTSSSDSGDEGDEIDDDDGMVIDMAALAKQDALDAAPEHMEEAEERGGAEYRQAVEGQDPEDEEEESEAERQRKEVFRAMMGL
jgi:hypothetical protein